MNENVQYGQLILLICVIISEKMVGSIKREGYSVFTVAMGVDLTRDSVCQECREELRHDSSFKLGRIGEFSGVFEITVN